MDPADANPVHCRVLQPKSPDLEHREDDQEVMEEQAAVLRHLLVHLETKEAAGDSEDGLGEEFSRLKTQSIQYRNDNTFPSRAALTKDNVKKNRYKDIVPFDHTRVTLSLNISQHDGDYINASFIEGVTGSRAYIATQGPLPHTLLDFFRMIWEYKIQVVVMACREFEMGRVGPFHHLHHT
ncbi:hypothetical protein CRUP_000612 [Coryphaenoides rupestris]|nr:hypothetical protein CRUP_000612 [Coryphaenoides rupestris]